MLFKTIFYFYKFYGIEYIIYFAFNNNIIHIYRIYKLRFSYAPKRGEWVGEPKIIVFVAGGVRGIMAKCRESWLKHRKYDKSEA